MEPTIQSEPKLNIFALPNQTTIIFSLTVTILLGTVFAGSFGLVPFPVWPLAVGLLFLSLKAFLSQPEREFVRYNLTPANHDLAALQDEIADISQAIGLRRIPKLMPSPDEKLTQPYTFGTFRHWYIAINHEVALNLQEGLDKPDVAPVVQAKLIHELYHYKTGDYWQMGYAGALLRSTFLFMLWAFTFLFGYGLLLVIAVPDVVQTDPAEWVSRIDGITPEISQMLIQMMPSPDAMEEVRQKAATLNLGVVINFTLNATMPFVIVGIVLWKFYWPKLWRTREFYADAGVVHTQKEILPYLSAFTKLPLPLLRKYSPSGNTTQTSKRQKKGIWDRLSEWWLSIRKLTVKHPDGATRIVSMKDPNRIFDTWQGTAIFVGIFTVLLDLVLNSSLTLFYVAGWSMHLSTLIILIVISLNRIHLLVQNRSFWPDMIKIVVAVITFRLILILFLIGILIFYLIADPKGLALLLTTSVATVAGFSRYMTKDEFELLAFKAEDLPAFVAEASILNLAQVFIIFFVLIVSLSFINLSLRRLLTWYGFPRARQRLMKMAYLVIGLEVSFFGLIILSLLTMALLRPADLLSLSNIIIGTSGFIIIIIGLGLFLRADKRYARRCPHCNKLISGSYELGKRCSVCDELLHPWLIADYEL